MFYKSRDFTIGLKVEVKGKPYIILENKFINPGKGQAFNKLKLKDIFTGVLLKKTIKIGEKLKAADVFFCDAKFLYFDDDIFHFIDVKSFEYYEVSADIVEGLENWIKENLVYSIIFLNGDIAGIKLPRFINMKVVATNGFLKSNVSNKFQLSTLENGLNLKVPLFVKEGDIIKIDTEKNTYISRVN